MELVPKPQTAEIVVMPDAVYPGTYKPWTIIEMDGEKWIKIEDHLWEPQNFHCVDCVTYVHEEFAGRDLNRMTQEERKVAGIDWIDLESEKASDFFKEFKVISLPVT